MLNANVLAAIAQGLGENHPQVKLHDSQISILREEPRLAKVRRVRDLLKVST